MVTVAGVLLAGGRGARFGGAKLLAPLPGSGMAVGVAALRALREAIPDVVAVVRPDDDELARVLAGEGARVLRSARAHQGMGASLASGVASLPGPAIVVVALADMPWVRPATIRAVLDPVARGALVAAPCWRGERGHPVAFAASLHDELAALGGDEGAKRVLAGHRDALVLVDVDDPGVLRDVDTLADLAAGDVA